MQVKMIITEDLEQNAQHVGTGLYRIQLSEEHRVKQKITVDVNLF